MPEPERAVAKDEAEPQESREANEAESQPAVEVDTTHAEPAEPPDDEAPAPAEEDAPQHPVDAFGFTMEEQEHSEGSEKVEEDSDSVGFHYEPAPPSRPGNAKGSGKTT
jgi:hypothetical protein